MGLTEDNPGGLSIMNVDIDIIWLRMRPVVEYQRYLLIACNTVPPGTPHSLPNSSKMATRILKEVQLYVIAPSDQLC